MPRDGSRSFALLIAGTVLGALVVSPLAGSRAGGGDYRTTASRHNDTKVKVSRNFVIEPAEFNGGRVFCPSGYEATGGGVDASNVLDVVVTASAPIFGPRSNSKYTFQKARGSYSKASGWGGFARNDGSFQQQMKLSVVCTRN